MKPAEIERLRKIVRVRGVRGVARELGIDRVTLLRVLAECVPVQAGSLALVQSNLPKVLA